MSVKKILKDTNGQVPYASPCPLAAAARIVFYEESEEVWVLGRSSKKPERSVSSWLQYARTRDLCQALKIYAIH
jgi:hypothetical protein